MALFDYSGVKTFEATLVVDDPGNCAILASGYYSVAKGVKLPCDYLLIVNTVMGQTTIIKCGPCLLQYDDVKLPSGYSAEVKSFTFKETSINKEITLFLNDGLKSIFEAKVIDIEEAIEYLPRIENFIETLT